MIDSNGTPKPAGDPEITNDWTPEQAVMASLAEGGPFKEFRQNQRSFLMAFAVCGDLVTAAKAARISLAAHWHWRRHDDEYAAAFEQATEMAGDVLESKAMQRAVNGVKKMKFYKGQPITVQGPDGREMPYVETEHPESLVQFMLKGLKPEKYRERHEVTGNAGLQVQLVLPDNKREQPVDGHVED